MKTVALLLALSTPCPGGVGPEGTYTAPLEMGEGKILGRGQTADGTRYQTWLNLHSGQVVIITILPDGRECVASERETLGPEA